MNKVAEEILDVLIHSGVAHDEDPPGRGSGRHPWGSGENPYQHSTAFLARIKELEGKGYTEKQIADDFEISTTRLRARKSLAKAEIHQQLVDKARKYRQQGMSLNEIADKMGYKNDSSVRNLLDEDRAKRADQAMVTANYIRKIVDEKGVLDVGAGVERELGVSKEKLGQALEILQDEGYPVYGRGIQQATNSKQQTNVKLLCPPGTEYRDIYNKDLKINSVMDYDKEILTDDGDKIISSFQYPASMDSKRLKIRYGDEGGSDKDGVVEIRRGVDDLSLGDSHYAQVRILVDGTHYIKGMAVYSDGKDMPEGVDVIFNTNKKSGTPALGEKDNTVLKTIKNDPANPFGSLIKEKGGQSYYISKDGTEKLSLINKRSEEGDWNDWSDRLPSQFLSKQPLELVNRQLNLTKVNKIAEHDEIISLTNPSVKRVLLEKFAEECDSAAVHLQSAALPRQKYQVILPLTTISDKEVYAPNYIDGERVALIRYPHGGTFEIPILKVNNKIKEGNDVIGSHPIDAVGINSKIASILSGADFDGDTVMVIPISKNIKIKNREPLEGLKDFDPKMEYGPGSTTKPYKRMKNTQTEMGIISNLITDMTIKGATDKELERAVKHSMVVIDAEKHNLDYKRSYEDNGIAQLKRKYQGRVENGKYREGASTLISRAKNEVSVPKRRGMPIVNEDGSLSYKTAKDLTYVDPKGKVITKTQPSTQMAETKDARTLSSGHPIEEAYANYANSMKALANQSRKEAMSIKPRKVSQSAKETYKKEVASLNSKLNLAEKNAPRERLAQIRTNSEIEKRFGRYTKLSKEDKELKKKLSQQLLTSNRLKVGAKRYPITIDDKEWEAIQAGAVPDTKLQSIFKYADMDSLKQRATPRTSNGALPDWKIAQIKSMASSKVSYSNAQIADRLGVSVSTVNKYLKGSD